ncbi:hypothetical protein WOLCODRAFT_166253 [Wolfiporia cocos MD-104 SS10]|uniref:F-box domain-containing protein n=1 Tax=Wolfiporia cocos (strain MD-104) TaxID=742152 RepID=A0A2H3JFB0_WOLCO|nr:hypothetical protein WOLCODRAFT_166253 [Wolfiporia cocos MD-104 SS10]
MESSTYEGEAHASPSIAPPGDSTVRKKLTLFSLEPKILDHILSMIKPEDAWQLSKTCHAAYNIAIPRFLSEITLDGGNWSRRVQGSEHTTRFYSYIFMDPSHRLPQVKSLTVSCSAFVYYYYSDTSEAYLTGEEDYSPAGSLADAIVGATNLERLQIDGAERLFEESEALADAVAVLSALSDVEFQGAGLHTLSVISRMASRPRRIALVFQESDTDADDDFQYPDSLDSHIHFLANFTESLVYLDLAEADFDFIHDLAPDAVWPNVQSLSLSGGHVTPSALRRAFPGVRTLRLMNVTYSADASEVSWPALDFLIADRDLPVVGSIRRLQIEEPILRPDLPPVTTDLATLLKRTSPVVVSCVPQTDLLSYIADSVSSVRFIQLFLEEAQLSDASLLEDPEASWDAYIPTIARSSLEGVTIKTGTGFSGRSVAVRDTLSVAEAVVNQIPSLRYVGLNFSNTLDNVSNWENVTYTWYRVSAGPTDASPKLEALPDWEGELVLKNLLNMTRNE